MNHVDRLRRMEWSKQWRWQMFNVNLACGALSVVVSTVPYKFRGQHALGCIFFIANLAIYIGNITMTIRRMRRWPKIWRHSFYDQQEAVWFPVISVAMATLIIGTLIYGVPYTGRWLLTACEVWYWVYMVLAALTGITIQATLRTMARSLEDICPADALEIYPLMFLGVVGSTLAGELVKVDAGRSLVVAIFSYIFAGLGFFVGLLKLSVWVHKDMTTSSARPDVIPSYLISVGVPGFTSLTLINLAQTIQSIAQESDLLTGLGLPETSTQIASIIAVVSVLLSLLLLGMATWLMLVFFGFVVVAFARHPGRSLWDRWAFTWWGWTFPLTGVVLTFGRLATYLPSKAFGVLNIVYVIGMAVIFFVNAVGTIRMLWRGSLPGTSAESDDGHSKPNNEPSPPTPSNEV